MINNLLERPEKIEMHKLTYEGVRNFETVINDLRKEIKYKKDNKIKNGLKLINKIQKIRSRNNKNWMDLLRLSLKLDFKSTSKILKDIVSDDKKISDLAKKIYRLK